MTTIATIDSSITVNEALQRFPAAVTVLAARGIDSCCRGNETIADAAASAGVDLTALLRDIASARSGSPSAEPVCSCCRAAPSPEE